MVQIIHKKHMCQDENRKVELIMEDIHLVDEYHHYMKHGTLKWKHYIGDALAFSIQDENYPVCERYHCVMIGWRRMNKDFHAGKPDITSQDALESQIAYQNGEWCYEGVLVKPCTLVTTEEHQAELYIECVKTSDDILYLKPTLVVNGIRISLKKEFAENLCFTDMDLRFRFNDIKKYFERDQSVRQIKYLSRKEGKMYECQYRDYRFYMTYQLYNAINYGRSYISAEFIETGDLFKTTKESKRRYAGIKISTGDYPVLAKVTKDNEMVFEPRKKPISI